MDSVPRDSARREIEEVFRRDSGRILATLISLLGDFDRAEEALQEAMAAALVAWPESGTPASPRAWLVSTARFKAIDRLRREANLERKLVAEGADPLARAGEAEPDLADDSPLADDRLKLLFTCCHPAIAPEAQVALALRTLCGLTSEEIARAFLLPVATLQQRLVRAKAKIRDARIPYRVPEPPELPERLAGVLRTVYLVFNEGYAASAGDALVRVDLCREAIRLARLASALLPESSEAEGLLALQLLHDSRRAARVDAGGEIVLLADQDRSLWDRAEIREGTALVERILRRTRAPGPFALQAAIAAVHARAATAAETDWREIAGLYELLRRVEPSPIVELNQAVAIAEAFGAERGLARLDALLDRGELAGYHLLPAARAELLSRLGRQREARHAYETALSLVTNAAERRFLERKLAALGRQL